MPLLARQLVDSLPQGLQLEVLNALGASLHDVRFATQCVSSPGPQAETVVQLLAYVNRSIAHLQRVQQIIQEHAS
jgi:hypothetical protein